MVRAGGLQSALRAEAAVDLDLLDDVALSQRVLELLHARDRLDAVVARTVAVHDQRSVWKADGASSQKAWLAERARMSMGEAASTTQTARGLTQLPGTLTALTDGAITSSQAQAAAKAVRDLSPDAIAGLDRLVAQHGPDLDAGQLRTAVNDYAHRSAPESLERRQERAYRLRRLRVAKTPDDAISLEGRWTCWAGRWS